MKKIGFITANKVLAQSLATAIGTRPELQFQLYPLLSPRQATLDAEVLNIDAALIDVTDSAARRKADLDALCLELRQVLPACRLLLLVPQEDPDSRALAMTAVQQQHADDFVFYDASLDYLFAKLAAI